MDRAAVQQTLVELLENSTGEKYEHLTEDQNLRESLNLDSIDMVTLVIEIQSRFSIRIVSEELTPLVHVRDVLDLIQAKLAKLPKSAAA